MKIMVVEESDYFSEAEQLVLKQLFGKYTLLLDKVSFFESLCLEDALELVDTILEENEIKVDAKKYKKLVKIAHEKMKKTVVDIDPVEAVWEVKKELGI